MKKKYIEPAMRAVKLQHRTHILSGSPGAKSLNNSEGFNWGGTLGGDDEDM